LRVRVHGLIARARAFTHVAARARSPFAPSVTAPSPEVPSLRVRVLGSGAGGGVPQWNCGCANCRAARATLQRGDPAPDGRVVHPRTQSSIAVSTDGSRWLLVNASPDVRTQLNAFAPFGPPPGAVRGTGVAAVLVTNADIDHTAGLLVLREGGAPPIYGTARVRDALTRGLTVLPVLAAYGQVEWRDLGLNVETPVRGHGDAPLGLRVTAFPVASKPAPYMLAHLTAEQARDDLAGDTVGLLVRGAAGGTLAYVPGVRDLDDALADALAQADAILIDGTFFTDGEMLALGASRKTAHAMGHAPLDGPDGLLAFLARFPRARRVLIHINNSNPVLAEGSAARAALAHTGVALAHDGLELAL
jgi:pyrroloquinoline quinone biosynthesis protein B